MFEWNLWRSTETALQIQRILCVSPFYLDRSEEKLKTCCMAKLYITSITLSCLVLMYFSAFHWDFLDTFIALIPSGMVWKILCYYGVISTNVHFILNMFIIRISLKQQIEFLERIHTIDGKFKADFKASVNHKDYKRKLTFVLVILWFYYGLQVITEIWFSMNTGQYNLIAPTFVYGLQQLIMNAQIYTMANYLFLLRGRYRLILSAYQPFQQEFLLSLKCKISTEKLENLFTLKLLKIFELFRDITQLVRLYDNTFGWIFASYIIRTFMNVLMQLYVIFLTLSDAEMGSNGIFMTVAFAYVFVGEFAKMIWIIIAIHSVYAAVSNTFPIKTILKFPCTVPVTITDTSFLH